MAITIDEVLDLMNRFHETVMIDKGDAAAQSDYFVHPSPVIVVPHGEDITMQGNYEIHQRLTDGKHIPLDPWEITPLSSEPERARAVGAVCWEGRVVGAKGPSRWSSARTGSCSAPQPG